MVSLSTWKSGDRSRYTSRRSAGVPPNRFCGSIARRCWSIPFRANRWNRFVTGTTATADLKADVAVLKRRSVATIRKARGATMAFTWLKPGTAAITWKARKTVVARGRATRTAAGAGTVRVKLTAAGRKRLKRKPVPKLAVAAVFVGTDGTKVTAKSSFKPRKR